MKNKKAKKAIDGDDNELTVCLLTTENKKGKIKKKIGFKRMLKLLWMQVCYAPYMVTLFICSQKHMGWRFQSVMSHHE